MTDTETQHVDVELITTIPELKSRKINPSIFGIRVTRFKFSDDIDDLLTLKFTSKYTDEEKHWIRSRAFLEMYNDFSTRHDLTKLINDISNFDKNSTGLMQVYKNMLEGLYLAESTALLKKYNDFSTRYGLTKLINNISNFDKNSTGLIQVYKNMLEGLYLAELTALFKKYNVINKYNVIRNELDNRYEYAMIDDLYVKPTNAIMTLKDLFPAQRPDFLILPPGVYLMERNKIYGKTHFVILLSIQYQELKFLFTTMQDNKSYHFDCIYMSSCQRRGVAETCYVDVENNIRYFQGMCYEIEPTYSLN